MCVLQQMAAPQHKWVNAQQYALENKTDVMVDRYKEAFRSAHRGFTNESFENNDVFKTITLQYNAVLESVLGDMWFQANTVRQHKNPSLPSQLAQQSLTTETRLNIQEKIKVWFDPEYYPDRLQFKTGADVLAHLKGQSVYVQTPNSVVLAAIPMGALPSAKPSMDQTLQHRLADMYTVFVEMEPITHTVHGWFQLHNVASNASINFKDASVDVQLGHYHAQLDALWQLATMAVQGNEEQWDEVQLQAFVATPGNMMLRYVKGNNNLESQAKPGQIRQRKKASGKDEDRDAERYEAEILMPYNFERLYVPGYYKLSQENTKLKTTLTQLSTMGIDVFKRTLDGRLDDGSLPTDFKTLKLMFVAYCQILTMYIDPTTSDVTKHRQFGSQLRTVGAGRMHVSLFYNPFGSKLPNDKGIPQHRHTRVTPLQSSVRNAAVEILKVLWMTKPEQQPNAAVRTSKRQTTQVRRSDGTAAKSFTKQKYLVEVSMFSDYIKEGFQSVSGYTLVSDRQWEAKHWDLDKFKNDFTSP
jgi:hypothetical protein